MSRLQIELRRRAIKKAATDFFPILTQETGVKESDLRVLDVEEYDELAEKIRANSSAYKDSGHSVDLTFFPAGSTRLVELLLRFIGIVCQQEPIYFINWNDQLAIEVPASPFLTTCLALVYKYDLTMSIFTRDCEFMCSTYIGVQEYDPNQEQVLGLTLAGNKFGKSLYTEFFSLVRPET